MANSDDAARISAIQSSSQSTGTDLSGTDVPPVVEEKGVVPKLGAQEVETDTPITPRLSPQQSMQKVIVWFVVGLLSVAFGAVIVSWVLNPALEISNYAANILAPVLALSGPVLGFYFNRRGKN